MAASPYLFAENVIPGKNGVCDHFGVFRRFEPFGRLGRVAFFDLLTILAFSSLLAIPPFSSERSFSQFWRFAHFGRFRPFSKALIFFKIFGAGPFFFEKLPPGRSGRSGQ